jgi:uncharacterized membrane protein
MPLCHLSKKHIDDVDAISAEALREGIYNFIQNQHPSFTKTSYISISELNKFRRIYLSHLIAQEKIELEKIDKEVITALENNEYVSANIETEMNEDLSFGQRMADKLAGFGGSWVFIIAFFIFLLVWMFVNVWVFATKPFDPYPFILLNLILSCLAAIQAPVIMMSQNRKEQKDRLRSMNDYKINLKAEMEIKILSDKIDHLMAHQNKKLLEIQELQTDYLEDLITEVKRLKQN